jgi:hypothetical protein
MPIYVGDGHGVPDCRGKVCEEAWLLRYRYTAPGSGDFQAESEPSYYEQLYLRWHDEEIWHDIFFDYGAFFWYQRPKSPFETMQIDRETRRSQPDENGKWYQMLDWARMRNIRGLALRSVRGGQHNYSSVAVLTFDGGAPERDIHLAVWENTARDMISRIGGRDGVLEPSVELNLDQDLVGRSGRS